MRKKISYLRIEFFLFVKTWIPFTKGCFVRIAYIGWSQEKKIFNIVNVFLLVYYYPPPPLRKNLNSLNYLFIFPWPSKEPKPFFEEPESPSPKAALCHVWLKLALWFWRRKFFNLNSLRPSRRAFGSGERNVKSGNTAKSLSIRFNIR